MLKKLALTTALTFPALAQAEVPRVVADIPPVHSLAAQVMGDLGAPELLTKPGTNPHGHSLRPSEAARLQSAEVLVWIGPIMSPWLGEAQAEMAPNAVSLALMEDQGTTTLKKRGADHHHHGEEEHGHDDHEDEHKHDEDHAHDDEHKHDDHDDHAEDDDHAHDDHADDAHDDHEEATGQRPDPHVWMSPDNAVVWLGLIADALAKADADNAETYRANAAAAVEAIRAQSAEIEQRIAKVAGLEFLTAHDAYQYFETRFGLTSHAAITDSEDKDAGPTHLREVLETSPGLGCFVTEASTPKATIELVSSTLNIPAVEIDPLGAALPLGAGHYGALMEALTSGFERCLTK